MSVFSASRTIPATVEQVFTAFSDPQRLAYWWGPAGFTNNFSTCEFKPGGCWSFTMHGPDGRSYRNESIFEKIDPPNKIVIRHLSEPKFGLTITLTPSDGGTLLSWLQEFDEPEVAHRLEHILRPANEQNLDRLSAEVAKMNAP